MNLQPTRYADPPLVYDLYTATADNLPAIVALAHAHGMGTRVEITRTPDGTQTTTVEVELRFHHTQAPRTVRIDPGSRLVHYPATDRWDHVPPHAADPMRPGAIAWPPGDTDPATIAWTIATPTTPDSDHLAGLDIRPAKLPRDGTTITTTTPTPHTTPRGEGNVREQCSVAGCQAGAGHGGDHVGLVASDVLHAAGVAPPLSVPVEEVPAEAQAAAVDAVVGARPDQLAARASCGQLIREVGGVPVRCTLPTGHVDAHDSPLLAATARAAAPGRFGR